MADENSPVEDRLEAASAYFVRLGGKMHDMAEQVRELRRQVGICEDQRLFDARQEVVKAEGERDEAQEHAGQLEDDIDAMRLGIMAPEEVIEREREWQP